MDKIIIKKSNTADTRTCDWTKITKEQLLESSKSHIEDVRKGILALIDELQTAAIKHDHTKIESIDLFHADFKTGFKNTTWWEMHQRVERHHFNNSEFAQDDINLIDVLEQIIDGVMAGMARSGTYRKEVPSPELLVKAYENTAKMLLDKIEVLDEV